MKKDNTDFKQFSQPNFSAQDAWKNMHEILDKEMPVAEKRKKRVLFFWLFGLLVLGTGTYIYFANNASEQANFDVAKINNNNKKNDNTKPDVSNNGAINNSVVEGANNESISNKNAFDATKNSSPTIVASNSIITLQNNIIDNKKTAKENFKTNKNNSENIFKLYSNASSFSDIRALKIAKGEVVNKSIASNRLNDEYGTQKNDDENIATKKEEQKNTLSPTLATVKTVENNIVKVPKNKQDKALHYGLQWNIVLPQTNSYLNYNAQSQPLTIVIPEFWVSKSIGKKSELGLQLNPYSQYTLKNNNTLASRNYETTVSQGSGQNPTIVNYNQTRSLVKAIGVELTAKYTYKINNKLSIAVGVGNNWMNAAVVNERIKASGDKVVHDSLYGIAKGFNDWDYLKSSFVVGRLEALYQFKKVQIGVAFLKPLGSLYSFSNSNNNPINGRLVLRWKIK